MELTERLEAKLTRDGDGHHLWTASVNTHGVPVIKVSGKLKSVRRLAVELGSGQKLPDTARVLPCLESPMCVRAEHLRVEGTSVQSPARSRARKGSGAISEIRPGVFKLSVVAGRHADGTVRRGFRTIHGSRSDASRALAEFVADVGDGSKLPRAETRNLTVDGLLELYIHSCSEASDENPKVWEHSTRVRYEGIRSNWIKPAIGHIRAQQLGEEDLDRCFAKMRRLGASRSHMNQVRSLLSGAFKWARRSKLVSRNPVLGYELPKSSYVQREVVPPEIDELVGLLKGAIEKAPEIAPVLSLAATTGMRRGELSGLKRSKVDFAEGRLFVDWAVNDAGGVVVEKGTKTHETRWVSLDPETVDLLAAHFAEMDHRAGQAGATVGSDAYVFSLEIDCSKPMRPEFMTRRTRQLRRSLDLTDAPFDATILALRKFTSSELTDAGFSPSLVSGRQGHTVDVMLKHYAKARRSADRKAADHLGSRVHGKRLTPTSGAAALD